MGWDGEWSGIALWGINRRQTDKGSPSLSVVIEDSVCACVHVCMSVCVCVCVCVQLYVFYAEDAGWGGGFLLQLSMST